MDHIGYLKVGTWDCVLGYYVLYWKASHNYLYSLLSKHTEADVLIIGYHNV